jgi:hypothetical protein
MHSSMHVRVYLSAMSNPVIESCSAIAFAEYPSLAFPPNSSINGAVPPNVSTSDSYCDGLFVDTYPRVSTPKYKIFRISGRRRRQTGSCWPLGARTGTTFRFQTTHLLRNWRPCWPHICPKRCLATPYSFLPHKLPCPVSSQRD